MGIYKNTLNKKNTEIEEKLKKLQNEANNYRAEKAQKIIDIMEQAVELQVPNKVDFEKGNNWGDIE